MPNTVTIPASEVLKVFRQFGAGVLEHAYNGAPISFSVEVSTSDAPVTVQPPSSAPPALPVPSEQVKPHETVIQKIGDGLKWVGKEAVTLAPQAVGPTLALVAPEFAPLVPIISTLLNAITHAATTSASAPAKKAAVTTTMANATPLLQAVLAGYGVNVADPAKLSAGIDQLVEGLVPTMKALGLLPDA